MKTGIISIHYSFITCHYGSLLQLYAMQRAPDRMSIQSTLIRQKPALPHVPAPPSARQKPAYYLLHPVRFLARCARLPAPTASPMPPDSTASFPERTPSGENNNIPACRARIYKKEIPVKNKIKFQEGVKFAEYLYFTAPCFCHCSSVTVINKLFINIPPTGKQALQTTSSTGKCLWRKT